MTGISPDRPDPPDPPDRPDLVDPPEPPEPADPPAPPGPTEPPMPVGTLEPDDLEPFVPPESPADADSDATDASRLLVQAVGQLPPADRDRVYAWLLRTGFRSSPAGVPGPLAPRLGWELGRQPGVRTQTREWGAAVVAELVRGSSSQAQQMVPVRFSADQHARLRAWCGEHGFSMATVIRGLVDHFLESQQPERG
jgi:ParG